MMDDLVEDLNPVIAAKLREVLRQDEHVLVRLPGAFKEGLICTDSRCLIIKAGFMTRNSFGTNVFQLPYANVTSAEVKFGLVSGYFELSSGGMQNTVKSYWDNSGGHTDAKAAPNSVALNTKKYVAKFQQAATFIMDRSADRRSPQVSRGGSSVADEIGKLASLLEKGFLSDVEFNEQKHAVLQRTGAPVPASVAPTEPVEEEEAPRPRDNIDRAIEQALRERASVADNGGARPQGTRPTFGRRRSG